MATTVTAQIPTNSLDLSGITISTATPSSSDVRAGTAYNATTLAAAQLIHFHPTFSGQYLTVMSRAWSAATPAGGAGSFSTYTESTTPTWITVDGPSGQTTTVPNYPTIPFKSSPTSPTLVGGASRPPNYLYLLHSGTVSGAVSGILQQYSLSTNGSIALAAEEVIPPTAVGDQTVTFTGGVQYVEPYIQVYGADTTGAVYQIQKLFSKVGINTAVMASPKTHGGVVGTQVGWNYYSGTGYSPDATDLAPLTTTSGTLTTNGPMSFGSWRNQTYLVTTTQSGTDYSANIWSSRSGRPITPMGSSTPLGSTSDGSYLGGTLQLQNQLTVNPTALSGAASAIPAVVSTKVSSGGNSSLLNTWSLVPLSV